MKRKIEIHSFLGANETATIVINKYGMSVINKSRKSDYKPDDHFYGSFIMQCIDMDNWQNSRHISINKAMYKRTKERKQCRDIMLDKIKAREEEIQFLKDGIQVLGRC